jgi:uncharacterized damage-inducible protein DinB
MNDIHLGREYLKELEMEVAATRKCLERIPETLFEYKPHDRSMKMGYLALMLAEIPRWITIMTEEGEVNFATFKSAEPKTTAELLQVFDGNIAKVREVLTSVSNEALQENCYLKSGEQTLMTSTKQENVFSCINHLVHHRGQLTVYMRLNDIPVPSIYGPSADDKTF